MKCKISDFLREITISDERSVRNRDCAIVRHLYPFGGELSQFAVKRLVGCVGI